MSLLIGSSLSIAPTLTLATPIAPDTSLPENSTVTTTVTTNGNRYEITGGTQRGTNLFHSFREFSVPTGTAAIFNQAIDVQNIFTRVTGSSVSRIDGLIQANGTANLFLLNPNGIIFGANARLDLGGSFIGSTASRIQFADGNHFSAIDPAASSLLSVSVPVGLQMGVAGGLAAGQPAGAIRVEGLGYSGIVPLGVAGLAVAPGRTLALVGQGVAIDGGILTAPSGRVEIGSLSSGTVNLVPTSTGIRLAYSTRDASIRDASIRDASIRDASIRDASTRDTDTEYSDLQLLNRAALFTPSFGENPQGGIQVRAANITLNNAQIISTTLQGGSGGDIAIHATERLALTGVDPTAFPFASWIVNLVPPGLTGSTGEVRVSADRIHLQDGARIQTLNVGTGRAGNVTVQANQIQINGYSPLSANPLLLQQFINLNSRIANEAIFGRSGDLQITARQINLTAGGQILGFTTAPAPASGGDVRVNVTGSIAATGGNPFDAILPSGIAQSNEGSGSGGTLSIQARTLNLQAGAGIRSSTSGIGRGSDVRVRVTDSIVASGTNAANAFFSSGILNSTQGSGSTGSLEIATQRLVLRSGGGIGTFVIDSGTRTPSSSAISGSAGDVTIRASQSIEVNGFVPRAPDRPSIIGSSTLGSGRAGNVTLSTQRLSLLNGGNLSSGTFRSLSSLGRPLPEAGTGDGGHLSIEASAQILVQGRNPQTNVSSAIGSFSFGAGDAGNTRLRTPRLILQEAGSITVSASAEGNAGRLLIQADDILIDGSRSTITAAARREPAATRRAYFLPTVPTGNTGALVIHSDRLVIRNQGTVTVQHEGTGNAGTLQINANQILLDRQGRISAATRFGGGGNLRLRIQDNLQLSDRAQISATAGGTGNGGNIILSTPFMTADRNSDIFANADRGRGGAIEITTQGIFGSEFRPMLTADNDITASSEFGIAGSVQLTTLNIDPTQGITALPTTILDPSRQIVAVCKPNNHNSFIITGRSGIPDNPDLLRSDRPWIDLRALPAVGIATPHAPNSTPSLIEATRLQVNANGQPELIANRAAQGPVSRSPTPLPCAAAITSRDS